MWFINKANRNIPQPDRWCDLRTKSLIRKSMQTSSSYSLLQCKPLYISVHLIVLWWWNYVHVSVRCHKHIAIKHASVTHAIFKSHKMISIQNSSFDRSMHHKQDYTLDIIHLHCSINRLMNNWIEFYNMLQWYMPNEYSWLARCIRMEKIDFVFVCQSSLRYSCPTKWYDCSENRKKKLNVRMGDLKYVFLFFWTIRNIFEA